MGSIFTISEFNCFKNPSIKKQIIQKNDEIKELKVRIEELLNNSNQNLEDLYDYSKKNDIILIPLVKKYNLENLYPVEDEVEKWNIFVVGNDKTYIQAKAPDFSKNIKEDEMLNTKGKSYMEERIFNFLDRIWDKTLNGQQIQIFVYTFRTLYLLNSYSLRNTDNNEIIGSICFMRDAGLVDKDIFDINNKNKDHVFIDAFTKRKNVEIELDNKYLNIKELSKDLLEKKEDN